MLPSRSSEAFSDRYSRVVSAGELDPSDRPRESRHRQGAIGAVSRAKLNAGNHGRHRLPKHKGRPWGAADVAEIAQQVKLVAGVGFEPTTFRL
jgi:hypothetical protein